MVGWRWVEDGWEGVGLWKSAGDGGQSKGLVIGRSRRRGDWGWWGKGWEGGRGRIGGGSRGGGSGGGGGWRGGGLVNDGGGGGGLRDGVVADDGVFGTVCTDRFYFVAEEVLGEEDGRRSWEGAPFDATAFTVSASCAGLFVAAPGWGWRRRLVKVDQ